MKIRTATTDDIAILSHIIKQSYKTVADRFELTHHNCPKHPSNCSDEWIEKDFSRGVQYHLLEADSGFVGCAAIEKTKSHICYLERLSVIPAERNKGLGDKLVKQMFQEARSMNFETMGIGIIAKQHELKNWYLKLGFVETGRKKFDHLPFEVLFMEFNLKRLL